jgi:protein-tyrosine-phosphatase
MTMPSDPFALITLLDDQRIQQLLTSLVLNDIRLQDLAAETSQSQQAVVSSLEPLHAAGVITSRRSDANSDDMYYHLDLDKLRGLYDMTSTALPPEFAPAVEAEVESWLQAGEAHPRVLFLCTQNSARSQLAEGLTRLLSKGRVEVFSAGNQPDIVHPMAIKVLEGLHIDISHHRSKHLGEFIDQEFDYVITICDSAREACPPFPSAYQTIHWSISDPVAVEGIAAQRRAFRQVANELRTRIGYLLIFLERQRRAQRVVG